MASDISTAAIEDAVAATEKSLAVVSNCPPTELRRASLL